MRLNMIFPALSLLSLLPLTLATKTINVVTIPGSKIGTGYPYAPQSTNDPQKNACLKDHAYLESAIDQLCALNHLTVPNDAASNGYRGDGGSGGVAIQSTCDPKAYVPQKYCYGQFYEMCAQKVTQKKFWTNGCQTFQIEYDGTKDPKVPN